MINQLENNTESVFTLTLRNNKRKENGKKEKELDGLKMNNDCRISDFIDF